MPLTLRAVFHFPVLEIPKELSREKKGRGRAAKADFAFLLFLNIITKKSTSRKLGIFRASHTFV